MSRHQESGEYREGRKARYKEEGGIELRDCKRSAGGVDDRIRRQLCMHLHGLLLLLLSPKILLLHRRVHHLLLVLLSIGRRRLTGYGGGLTARHGGRLARVCSRGLAMGMLQAFVLSAGEEG